MTIDRIGYGAGDMEFRQQANVLRILVGRSSSAAESTAVCVIEANIDDSSPQVLGYAMERLLDAGALDVTLQPIEMKKSRPGSLLQIICKPTDREALASIVFAETSTIGVRTYNADRIVEARRIIEIETKYGKIRVKVANSGNAAPEYEDCRALARASAVPLKLILAEAAYEYQKSIR
jgi:uncharacterized protein (DUF111 family)